MMHPDRSCLYGPRRHHGDRSTRQRDDYRWEERREPRRETQQDSYHKYGGDAPRCSERTSRSREYSDSPKTPHGRDSMNRERLRKSPPRRRVSSPDWSVSDLKRRRFAEGEEDDYRYRREPEEKTYRQSPDAFSRRDSKQDEDFKHRKTPQDSRNRHRREEFTYKQQHEDSAYRQRPSGFYRDYRDGGERSHGRSQDHNTKSCTKTRERKESPSTDHQDYRQNGTRFPLNGYAGQSDYDVSNQPPSVPEEKSANGFQRFLDVLNKGVNVDVLTKIVTQAPAPGAAGQRPCSQDRPWSPGQQGRQPYPQEWSGGGEESLGSFSPERRRSEDSSGSRSPSVAAETTTTPEDEHKHRQMQDVLRAIGMDLGFEELGQMSHRIQERLYGKKDGVGGGCSEPGRQHQESSREREVRAAFSPKPQSRSSPSSRSSFSPPAPNQDCSSSLVKDSYGASQDGEERSESTAAAFQTFSSEPMPTYSSYPFPSLPPPPPSAGTGFFLPPFLPYPCAPPLSFLSQTPPLLSHHQPHHLLPPSNLNPGQANGNATLKSKTVSRPRCLQVIETKQPG